MQTSEIPPIAPESEPAPENSTFRQPKLRSRRVLIREIAEIAVMVATIYTLVNLATARAIVEGASMEPNFFTNQLIIVNRFVYYFNAPARGDVIVLHDPEDPSQDFIKRVVGLPGEVVEIKGGRVYINGTLLEEPYIPHFCPSNCDGVWTLDADHYFVLGDNRPNSHDSHAFGPLDRKLIVGQAWIRYWPIPVIGVIPRPDYGPINTTPPPMTPTFTPIPRPPHTPVPVTPGSINRNNISGA